MTAIAVAIVSHNYVHAVNAKWIASLPLGLRQSFEPSGWSLSRLPRSLKGSNCPAGDALLLRDIPKRVPDLFPSLPRSHHPPERKAASCFQGYPARPFQVSASCSLPVNNRESCRNCSYFFHFLGEPGHRVAFMNHLEDVLVAPSAFH